MNNTWKKIMAFAVASCLGCASLFMLGGCGESGGADDPNDPPGDKPSEDEDGGGTEERAVTFSDEFDGGEISSAWEFQIGTGTNYGLVDWGNGEAQYYRRENASLEDGALKITLKRESYGGKDYTSARLRTKGSFSQTYGRFEARIKIDGGAGVARFLADARKRRIRRLALFGRDRHHGNQGPQAGYVQFGGAFCRKRRRTPVQNERRQIAGRRHDRRLSRVCARMGTR